MEKLGLGENSVIAKFKLKCEKEIEALDHLERDLDIKENIRLSAQYADLEKELKEIQNLSEQEQQVFSDSTQEQIIEFFGEKLTEL